MIFSWKVLKVIFLMKLHLFFGWKVNFGVWIDWISRHIKTFEKFYFSKTIQIHIRFLQNLINVLKHLYGFDSICNIKTGQFCFHIDCWMVFKEKFQSFNFPRNSFILTNLYFLIYTLKAPKNNHHIPTLYLT